MPLTTTDWLIVLVMLAVFALIVGMVNARRMDRIERKLNAILSNLGVGYVDGAPLPTPTLSPASPSSPSRAPIVISQSDQSAFARKDGTGEVGDLVMSYLRVGRKIEAIKALREQRPGMGLKEAKDIVDAIESGARQYPHT